MLKALQKRMKRLALVEALMSRTPERTDGLVGDDADRAAQDAGEADDDVHGVAGLDLQEVAAIDDAPDHLAHVVALLGIDRDDLVELGVGIDVVLGGHARRVFEVVRRQEAEQPAAEVEGLLVVLGDEVDDAGMGHVGVRAAERLGGDLLAGHLLDDLRPGDEHLGLARLDDEVGQGRRVGGPAGAGAADQRDLRHGPGEHDVGVEDPAVAGQRVDALLDAGAAGVVDEDERAAGLEGQLHHVGDLVRVDLAGGAAEDGEVLAGEVDEPAVDGGGAGDDAVGGDLLAGHAEVDLAVLGEQADLLEAAGIDEGVDALAGGELALLLLLGQAVGAAALPEALLLLAEVLDQLLHRLPRIGGHRSSFLSRLTRARRSPGADLSPIRTS